MLSGLDKAEMISVCNEDPCHRQMGIVAEEIGQDGAVCYLEIKPWHQNMEGVIHGGILSAVMDTTLGASVYPHIKADERILAIDLKINFIKAATLAMKRLRVDSRLVSRTSRLAISEGELLSPDGVLLCKAMGTFVILKR